MSKNIDFAYRFPRPPKFSASFQHFQSPQCGKRRAHPKNLLFRCFRFFCPKTGLRPFSSVFCRAHEFLTKSVRTSYELFRTLLRICPFPPKNRLIFFAVFTSLINTAYFLPLLFFCAVLRACPLFGDFAELTAVLDTFFAPFSSLLPILSASLAILK